MIDELAVYHQVFCYLCLDTFGVSAALIVKHDADHFDCKFHGRQKVETPMVMMAAQPRPDSV